MEPPKENVASSSGLGFAFLNQTTADETSASRELHLIGIDR